MSTSLLWARNVVLKSGGYYEMPCVWRGVNTIRNSK